MNLIDEDALVISTIWQEAEGEPYNAKVGVGEVIRERTRRHYSSDGTFTGTIARRFQFSSWNDDEQNNARLIKSLKLDYSMPSVQECMKAWYQSANTTLSRGAVLFVNIAISQPSWATSQKFLVKIGNISFYRD